MSNLLEAAQGLETLVVQLKEQLTKYEGGTKKYATEARKTIQQIKKEGQELRIAIAESKKK